MNYYEELGVERQSSIKEIRRAYRNLARLLHPDNFQNDIRRCQAELQMQHLNAILQTLTRPDEKQKYDEELSRLECEIRVGAAALLQLGEIPPELYETPLAHRLRNASMHWFSILSAMVFISSAAWYWASGLAQPLQSTSMELPPHSALRPEKKSSSKRRVGDAVNAAVDPDLHSYGSESLKSSGDRDVPDLPIPPELKITADTIQTEAPFVGPAFSTVKPVPEQTSLKGLWLLSPPKSDAKQENVYLPEYVELRIFESKGSTVGEYSARYHITNRPISPEVRFRLEAKLAIDDKALIFAWNSADGCEGDAELKILAPNILEMKWWTTKFGRPGSLASGYAHLVRQKNR